MSSRARLLLYGALGYVVLEIVVDDALVFLDLTDAGVPSMTVGLLSAVGLGPPAVADVPGLLSTLAWVSGLVGATFVAYAIYSLYEG